ncbi:hypothetical protein JJQ94_03515 [Pseudoalteromonas sp. GCY]|nr:hypothetical protein [Pseudoalteromonas sp. GCY]QQQ65513.1 hypothetical protein JJQ94_03515 [Pseudoalteromonas sp. GCY]
MNCKIRCSLIATALIISLSGCETHGGIHGGITLCKKALTLGLFLI